MALGRGDSTVAPDLGWGALGPVPVGAAGGRGGFWCSGRHLYGAIDIASASYSRMLQNGQHTHETVGVGPSDEPASLGVAGLNWLPIRPCLSRGCQACVRLWGI